MSRIEELKAKLAAAQSEAKAKALTDEEQEEAALLASIATEKEVAAAADAQRRASDMAARVEAAEGKAGRSYLVQGVDLVGLFTLGKSPPAGQLPGGGVIVIRNPLPSVERNLLVELEHKNGPGAKRIDAMLIDLLCKSVVDPDVDGAEGTTLRAFCEAYPAAAVQAAQMARRLGGAKAAEDKRGRG